MDPKTIPDIIWRDCSHIAEQLMRNLLAAYPGEYYFRRLTDIQYRNDFRQAICNRFYLIYTNANSLLTYTPSDLVGKKNDPGWQEFDADADWQKFDTGWQEFANVADVSKQDQQAWLAMDDSNTRTMRTPPIEAVWIADNARTQCSLPGCRKDFGIIRRKHHCRLCGDIFCDEHSRHQILVNGPLTQVGREPVGTQRKERVCDSCYKSFSQKVHSPLLGLQQDPSEHLREARPFAYITPQGRTVARMQFVVSTAGGMVLFSRLNASFHSYFLRHPNRKVAFYGFKVFSEENGKGRSDSAVVYLNVASDHRYVTDWWKSALDGNADLRSSVSTDATAYGLRDMGKGGWATDIPISTTQDVVLGANTTSAGDLIGNIIGVSFWLSVIEGEKPRASQLKRFILEDPDLGSDIVMRLNTYRPALIRGAKAQMTKLIRRLRDGA